MAARQKRITVTGGDPEDYVTSIVVEVSEKGECLLYAVGNNICTLFDAVRMAKEVLRETGIDVEVRFEKLGVVIRDDEKMPMVLVAVRRAGGGG